MNALKFIDICNKSTCLHFCLFADLVVLKMKKQPDDSPEGSNVREDRLQELVPKVKDLALTARKSGGNKAAAASDDGADWLLVIDWFLIDFMLWVKTCISEF